MADVKISQLPAATTPVDGTEVLPIVQSATTKQVSIANLTAGRAIAASSLTLTTPLALTSGGTGLSAAAQGSVVSATAADTFSATRTPTLGLAGTAAGTLGLSGVTSGVVTLATADAAGTWTMKLPTTGGTNGYILTTNGSGVTSWTNPTALGVDLDIGTTSITAGTVGRVLFEGSGNVLQESANFTFSTAALTLGLQQTAQGSLVLANTAAGAFATTLQGSNSASAAWTLTLPTTAGTNNYVLTTNGSGISSWSQVSLTAGVTGTLPTANGGTGLGGATPFTANGLLYASSTSALSTSSALTFDGTNLAQGNAGTARTTHYFSNTGGQLYVGTESSTGGAVFGSSSAYAGIIGTNNATVLQFATNGTVRTTIDSSGRLLVGTTSAAGSKIQSDGTGGAANATAATTAANASLALTSNSGLGTSTGLFAGVGSSAYTWLQAQNTGDNTTKNIVINPVGGNLLIGTATDQNSKLLVSTSNSATAGNHGFELGAFGIRINDTGGSNYWYLERSYGGWQTTPVMSFQASTGNIGIGTATPTVTLDIQQGTSTRINLIDDSATGRGGYLLSNGTNFIVGTTSSVRSLVFTIDSVERVKLDTSGNLLVTGGGGLGYGTGSGGTVTQATSKATGVTLNKTVGRITTNNAALAANTTVTFNLTNSTVGVNDMVVVCVDGNSTANGSSYNVWALTGNGTAYINIRNISGGSLSDILYINFAVIKGATS